jgi:TonB-dependent starch-binding outer membrane protein SusC
MKKIPRHREKLLKLMRISLTQIIFAGLCVSLSYANPTAAQKILEQKINLVVEDKPLNEVLTMIEQVADVRFSYLPKQIQADRKMTFRIENESLAAVLDKFFKKMPVYYEVIGANQILLSKKIPPQHETAAMVVLPVRVSNLKATTGFVIMGLVTDIKNEPLIGASVILGGTTKGAITDANGKFSLSLEEADKNGALVFSFVGYESQRIPIAGRADISIQLKESAALSEVVVIGYGTRKKADLTGSVASIDVEQMLTKPAADVSNMLQGRVSGVVSSGSNQPGGDGYVRIRGINSFGSNEPLVIIDGVQTSGTNSINPNDIETMNVLKDASSAAIYGARGAGGVIIITTKKGKPNKTRITYDAFYGISKVTRFPDMVNTAELGDLLWKQQQGAGIVPTSPQYGKGTSPVIPDYVLAGSSGGLLEGNAAVDPAKYNYDQTGFYQIVRANKEGTDWFKEMTQAAPWQSHNIGASGGNDRSVYSFSIGYYKEEGLQKYTNYDRYSARVNSEFKLSKRVRFGETLFGSFRKKAGSLDNNEGAPWSQAYRMQPIVPVYDINGKFAGSKAPGTGNGQNPVAVLYRARNNTDRDVRFLGSLYAEIDILTGLRFKSNFGMDYNNNYNTAFRDINPEHSEGNFQTAFSLQSGFQSRWTLTNTLNYDKDFGKHNINLLAGTEAVEFGREQVGGDRSGYYPFTDLSFQVLDRGNPIGQNNTSTRSEEALFSTFGRIDYAYNGKYLLNATLRRDGSSKFAKDFRYGNFPSASVGWRISQEPFMKNMHAINDLKLRAGYGVVGNDQIDANNQYSFYRSDPSRSFYDIGGTNTSVMPGYDLDRKGNSASKWEETSTLNIGLDLSMFKGAFEMSLDVYDKKTSDLLVQILRPGTEGDFTAPFINVGNTENKGVDLMLTYRGKINEFKYAATANFSAYRNKVSSEGVDFFTNTTRNSPVSRTVTGQAIGMFYGYVLDGFFNTVEEVMATPAQPGVNKTSAITAQQAVGRWRLKDMNGDNKITADDRTFLGSPHPKFQTGFNLDFGYKNFDANLFFFWNYGNQIYNNTKWWTDFNGFTGNRSRKMLYESWTPENKNASLPKLDANDNISNSLPHTYFVESGSYFRAKTMQLGYTIPSSLLNRLGMSKFRVYVQGQNLFTITKYTGPDPDLLDVGRGDIGLGVDHGRVPNPRQILGGLSITF